MRRIASEARTIHHGVAESAQAEQVNGKSRDSGHDTLPMKYWLQLRPRRLKSSGSPEDNLIRDVRQVKSARELSTLSGRRARW
jgi:hypothetical protein